VQGIQRIISSNRRRPLPKQTARIAKITIENIRSLSHVTLDLAAASNDPARFTVLYGNNGVGKTTILRSIALGLSPEPKALGLLETLKGDLLKRGAARGSITIEVLDSSSRRYTIRTEIERNKDGTFSLRRVGDDKYPDDFLFLAGYGAGRQALVTSDPASSYEVDAALRSLFDYTAPLQNPELIFRRMASGSNNSVDAIFLKVDVALGLEPRSTTMDSSGIVVQGPWGSFVPIGALGDGYQATLGWLVDFFGQHSLFDPDCALSAVTGIILIDEIEQHLHPQWQREIIYRLSEQLPGVQFIATSHSPVCAGGVADLDEGHGQIYVLQIKGEGVEAKPLPLPAGMRYDQIFTSELIGLNVARDRKTEDILTEMREAYLDPGSPPGSSARFRSANQRLKKRSVTAAEDERVRNTQSELLSTLKGLEEAVKNASKKSK
jgi:energy-coupling factor transporter ATP-binding protein EcfA2